MIFRNAVYTIAVIFFWLSQPAYAQSESEENRRNCNPTIVQLVGKHFGLRDFSYPQDGMYPSVENGGLIVAGVCKAWPTDGSKTIAAFAYDAGVDYEKQLIVSLVDIPKSRIIASYKGTIPEDAVTQVNDYSLRIDTAHYILSKDTRAFGLRVNSFRDQCGYDGGFDDALTLFVVDGKTIRPVLDLTMSHWKYSSVNRCGSEDVSRLEANLSLSVEPTVSHGFADLLITAKGDNKKPLRAKIHYDGKSYGLGFWDKNFNQWWE